MSYNRAMASEAVEAVLAALAEAYEVSRDGVEVESVLVEFTDTEGHTTAHRYTSSVAVSPDATADARARAEEFKSEVESKSPPTKKE